MGLELDGVSIDRDSRISAPDRRQQLAADQRARSLGRSLSRGRNNPSELLARRQQLLSAGQTEAGQSPAGGGAPEQTANDQWTSASSRVEAKLESLKGELLKSHHQSDSMSFKVQQPANNSTSNNIDDVYILLAKKEKDLQLAAELGKVLLEKNDELSKANERITEDYSHKLELLEQDKHKLKRKLDLLDGEYENRLIELQTDCNILKNQLDEQQQIARQTEKEKSKLIDDLVQQNQRLTSELVEATKSEELLSSQLEQMNERFNVRLSNRQDHVAQLDALKEEIQIVNQRKQDLERRLKLANSDKHKLSAALDESGDKLLLLENLLNEKDGQMGDLLEEVNELRDSSLWLSAELESMLSTSERLASAGADQQSSERLNQVAAELQSAASQRKRSHLIEQLRELRLKHASRIKANEFKLTNGGRRSATSGSGGRRMRRPRSRKRQANGGGGSLFNELNSTSLSSANSSGCEEQDDRSMDSTAEVEWSDELAAEIYAQLQRFQSALQSRKDGFQSSNAGVLQHLYSPPNSTNDSGISADDLGDYQAAAKDPASWRKLLSSLKSLIEEMPCSTCRLMIAERADYEQLQKLHAKLCDESRLKDDQLLALSVIKTEQETKVAALEERCAILSGDLKNCDRPKEEIVQLAWKARDEAVERKNAAEISLAKTRIENMQIGSQLMEVVQQKGELSQKLAQFEDDIHYITQDSVKAKFTWEEYAEKVRRSKRQQQQQHNSRRVDSAPTNSLSNPLAQLLNGFSVGSSNSAAGGALADANNKSTTSQSPSSALMDNLVTQPSSLVRNFRSNRFNLRFWQRNSNDSNEKTTTQQEVAATTRDIVPIGGNHSVAATPLATEQKTS